MWGRAPSLAYHLLRIIARLREQPDYVSPLNYLQTSCNGFGELSAGFMVSTVEAGLILPKPVLVS